MSCFMQTDRERERERDGLVYGQTEIDMKKLTVAFHNFTKAPKI